MLSNTMAQLRLNGVLCLAHLWEIVREDGFTLRFTDHNEPVLFEGQVYSPGAAQPTHTSQGAGGVETTAFERLSELNEANKDLSGALITLLDSDSITQADLESGLYRNARVTEYVVDWRFPFLGQHDKRVFWVSAVEFDGEQYKAELSNVVLKLKHNRGREVSRLCENRLGVNDGLLGCFYDIAANTDEFEVTSVTQDRVVFECDNNDESRPNNWSAYGTITWLTGANAGLKSRVKLDSLISGNSHAFTLVFETPYSIVVGDTGTVTPGCNKLPERCIELGQFPARFNGFPDTPGDDRQFKTPDAQ